MAWVERRVTRTSQPQDVVGIDWTNPNTRGLLGSWVGQGKGKASHGTDAVPQGDAVTKVGKSGVGLSNSSTGSNNFWKVERTAYTYTQQVTFEALIDVDVFTNVAPYISGVVAQYVQPGSSADDRGPFLRFGNGTSENRDKPFFAVMQNNTERGVLGPSLQTGRKYHLLGTYDGVSVKLFIDGILIGTTATTGTFENGSNAYVAIGTDYPGTSSSEFRALQGRIYLANIYNVGKTNEQARDLAANPWQIFEPEVERIWISDYIATGGLTQVQSDASLNYVLQAITFNSQGGMYSILGLVNSDINASYNVTESRINSSSFNYVINAAVTQDQPESYNVRAGVDSTQNETYNILGAVQQSQNEEYNVLASLSSTQGSTYNVRSALSKDQGSTYFISESTYREQLVDYVIRSQQHNDQSSTYSILSANSVGNNADLNYVISALIQQDQQENYLVRSAAHQETNGVYTVRSSADSTTEGSYAVRASLTGDATLDYSIRAEVNSSGSMSYTVRASLSKDQGLLYDILAASNVQASSSASYVIQATTANNTTCSYQIQGEVIDLPLTNAEMQQLYAWVGELVTKSATKEEIATAVWSKPQSELTVENSIGKWLMQKVLTVSKFLALK